MSDENWGEWHGWNGGECPVDGDTVIQAVFSDGTAGENKASVYGWKTNATPPVAYRIKKEPEAIETAVFCCENGYFDKLVQPGMRKAIITFTDGELDIDWAEGE